MYSPQFNKCWEVLLDHIEGRRAGKIKGDTGGVSKFGITEQTAKRHGLNSRSVTEPQAKRIAWIDYWIAPNVDAVAELSLALAFEMFEYIYWAGPSRPVKLLQERINFLLDNDPKLKNYPSVMVNGVIDEETMSALKVTITLYNGENSLVNSMNGEQYIFMKRRASEDGWFAEIFRGLTGARLHNPFLYQSIAAPQSPVPFAAPIQLDADQVAPQPRPREEDFAPKPGPSIENEKMKRDGRRLLVTVAIYVMGYLGVDLGSGILAKQEPMDKEEIAAYILEKVREGLEDPMAQPVREVDVVPVD